MIRKHIKRIVTGLSLGLSSLLIAVAAPVGAAPAYTLFGEASLVSDGSDTAVQTVSDTDPGNGGIDFDVSSGITFANLDTLSADFNVTDDDCGGGSPRFQINVDDAGTERNIFVYLGPSPSYTGCLPNTWTSSGDLLEAGMTVDTSQLAGGNFYDTYADALTDFGTLTVTGIQLVTDAGWSQIDGEQTVLFDNVNIDGTTFDFEDTVTVTIQKYLDGNLATAASADSMAFPMESSWDALNTGAGSGSYTLSPVGYNSTNAYEAVTSDMTVGADYATNEVTDGTDVAASCSPNGAPYALVGYTVGDTLEEAQTADPSTTAPSFTDLQGNKFVIVWNMTCNDPPTNKDQCKKGGWQTYGYFKNQGDCVSYVATKGRNQPAITPAF